MSDNSKLIERYELVHGRFAGEPTTELLPAKDGEWVQYAALKAADTRIAALEDSELRAVKRIAELKEKRNHWREEAMEGLNEIERLRAELEKDND